MKTPPFQTLRALPFALVALLALSACGTMSTIEGRSKEKSAAFTAAAPWQQKLMRAGQIDNGFTPDMVYIALDKPDKTTTADNGDTEVWTYNNFDPSAQAFGGGVKVTVQAGSASPGMGSNPNSAGGSRAGYISANASADLGSAQNLDPVSRLTVRFLHGKVDHVELKRD